MTKPTKWHVRPAKTQISLGIHPVWSESSLYSDQPGRPLSSCRKQTLIRLGGCPGWSESSLGAQPHCWFCHETAQILATSDYILWSYLPFSAEKVLESTACFNLTQFLWNLQICKTGIKSQTRLNSGQIGTFISELFPWVPKKPIIYFV